MTLLPIVGRELRVAARRRRTYWLRASGAGLALAAVALIAFSGRQMRAAELSRILFSVLGGLCFFYALFAGLGTTADCVSEEKREGTLGLLFLTDLRGYDVILGKLVATSLGALYQMLGIAPILAVPLLLGGLGIQEVLRMILVLMVTLLLSLSVGMFASAMSRRQRAAMNVAFVILLAVASLGPILGTLEAARLGRPVEPEYLIASPGFAWALCHDPMYQGRQELFVVSVSTVASLGLIFLGAASLIVPHAWQDRPRGVRQTSVRQVWLRWAQGTEEVRRQFRRRLLDRNAYYWLTSRNRLKPLLTGAVLASVMLVWLWYYLRYPEDMSDQGMLLVWAVILHLLIKAAVAQEVTQALAADRQAGALELLLSTPLTVAQIVEGHLLGVRRQLGWPILGTVVIDFFFYFLGARSSTALDHTQWTAFLVTGIGLLWLDLLAIVWVGIWLAATSRRGGSHAAAGTISRVLVLPGVLFFLYVLVLNWSESRALENGELFMTLSWTGICVFVDAALIFWARGNIYRHFRTVATQRFERRSHWWSRA